MNGSPLASLVEIAAAILRPYVRDDVYQAIRVHQDFQGRHYYHHFGGDVNAREIAAVGKPDHELVALEGGAGDVQRAQVAPLEVAPRAEHPAVAGGSLCNPDPHRGILRVLEAQ